MALAVLVGTLSLEAWRRCQEQQQAAERQRAELLNLIQDKVRDNGRILADWAQWDDTLAFVQGLQPAFISRQLATSPVLRHGGLVAIVDDRRQLLALVGASAADRQAGSGLQRCLISLAEQRLQRAQEKLAALCAGGNGLYLGGAHRISDSMGKQPSSSTLVYLVPLVQAGESSAGEQAIARLIPDLVLNADAAQAGDQVLQPPLWSDGGWAVRVRPVVVHRHVPEWLTLLLLAAAASPPLLLLRARWMLQRRQLQLQARQRQRHTTLRLRQSERQLQTLLQAQLQADNQSSRSRSATKANSRTSAPDGTPSPLALAAARGRLDHRQTASERDERIAAAMSQRLERVLNSTSSLLLLDGLTGLANRNAFLEELQDTVQRCRQRQSRLALLFINIERFKQINDTYGHATGDAVLRQVATLLLQRVNGRGFLARYGGDHFSLILAPFAAGSRAPASLQEVAIRQQAHCLATELIESCRNPRDAQPDALPLKLSIGIAISDPQHTSAQELIRRCDIAMFAAKRDQSRQISIFDIDSQWDALSDYRLFQALQTDIEQAPQRFAIVFQPIVDREGRICTLEALTRWQSKEMPGIPADLLFALAERHRLMPALGLVLLRRTLSEFQALLQGLDASNPGVGLALNISPNQLLQDDFNATLLAELHSHGINPERVTLEMTELAVADAHGELQQNLTALRQQGLRFALDDFGTGYSSLSLLVNLRPDEIKIDKSFVLAACDDPIALQIVRLLQALCQEMGMTLVAEGVEDQPVLELLERAGLGRFQGYLLARPQSRQELAGPQRPPRSA